MNMSLPIYIPKKGRPMNVIVFASGGGGNLKAIVDMSIKKSSLVKVGLVVTDRLGIPAIDIAKSCSIPVFAYDFESICGIWAINKKKEKTANQYTECARTFHNMVLKQIKELEKKMKEPFDLIVLSYHRWVFGDLLTHFKNRIINQHAADVTVMRKDNKRERKYIGINPVLYALVAGEKRTRTSTFLVQNGYDNGEILCQGPWVKYTGVHPPTKKSAYDHELIQKRESDWPSLTFAIEGIARGYFSILSSELHPDGCQTIYYMDTKLPYGGVDLTITSFK
ncbi:hypothetical protein HZA75_01780 [Candidatus Roizmanbacteria bacterium]|nr:hypothetical protein [Candidatus Roizmanbacteria bacterium]